jgi:hypothetical protein
MKAKMIKQCCGAEGNLDFDKMEQFMEGCGKHEFSDEDISMMKGFCGQEGMPDVSKMMSLMEKCRCHPE